MRQLRARDPDAGPNGRLRVRRESDCLSIALRCVNRRRAIGATQVRPRIKTLILTYSHGFEYTVLVLVHYNRSFRAE